MVRIKLIWMDFKDKIYVCGGFDGISRHNSMEFYDPTIDKWTLLDSASIGREGKHDYDKNLKKICCFNFVIIQ
jgi:hypothetical protein